MNSPSPDIKRAEIDAELRIIEDKVPASDVESNALTPVHQLPIENLVHIFSFLQSFHDGESSYQWTTILRVCHYWREVVLNASCLWCRIVSYGQSKLNSEWTRMSFIYSRNHLLDFRIYALADDPDIDLVFLTFSNLHRTRSLEIDLCTETATAFSSSQTQDIISSLEGPAPHLESVRIDNTLSRLYEVSDIRLFGGVTHQLQNLSIRDTLTFHFHNLSLPNLRTLALEGLFVGHMSSRITLQSILHLLKTTRLLNSLRLINAFCVEGPSAQGPNPLYLAHLSSFTIHGQLEECVPLLSQISIPPTTQTSVKCTNQSDGLCKAISRCFRSDPKRFHRLKYYRDQDGSLVTLTFWDTEDEDNSEFTSPLQITGLLQTGWLPLCQVFPISQLRSLEISGLNSQPFDYSHLAFCPILSWLKITRNHVNDFVKFIDRSSAALPSLRLLHLEHPPFINITKDIERLSVALTKRRDGPCGMLDSLVMPPVGRSNRDGVAKLLDGVVGEYMLFSEYPDIFPSRVSKNTYY